MALFDINLLFYHTGKSYSFTTGEFMPVVAMTLSSCTGLTVDMGVQQDEGIGSGEFVPKLALFVGSLGITSSSASFRVETQFQGSSDSTTWDVYATTGSLSTASYQAGYKILPIDLPRRPPGKPLPRYYRVVLYGSDAANTSPLAGPSTGSLIGGIVIDAPDSAGTMDQYASNFSVV